MAFQTYCIVSYVRVRRPEGSSTRQRRERHAHPRSAPCLHAIAQGKDTSVPLPTFPQTRWTRTVRYVLHSVGKAVNGEKKKDVAQGHTHRQASLRTTHDYCTAIFFWLFFFLF